MSRPKNEVIGEVECPTKACTKVCQVYRFRQRGTGATRFAGKLYAECPVHGRHGADGKAGTQDYILENAKIWGDAKKPASTEPAPDPAPAQSGSAGAERPIVPTVAPAPKTPDPAPAPAKVPRWWDLSAIIK